MGFLGYDKITITDLMDAVPASLTFTSNINSEVQKKQGNSYEPNFEEGEGLIITPSFFIGNKEISLKRITEELMGGSNQESHCKIFVVYQIGDDSYSYNENVSIDSSKIYVDIDNKLHYKQNLENSITIKGFIKEYEDKSTGSLYANIKVSNPITINFITFESGYSAFIENNGRNHFDENNKDNIILTPKLYYGAEDYSKNIKSYNWIKVNGEIAEERIDKDTGTLTITRADVGAFDKFICIIKTNEDLEFRISENIYDRTDGYQSRIVAYDSLIFTPNHTKIELENQIWYGTSQLNKEDSTRFNYSWFYFSKGEEENKTNILSSNDKNLLLDNSELPKKNFTLYCQTIIDEKTTVLSEIDIKYSAINYEVRITPETVYVPTNNEGTYRGTGTFSKTVNFKIIDLDTGDLVPFKSEEETKPTFSLEDSFPFLITIDENENEWNFNITISEKYVGAINKNSFSNDLSISFKYNYLGVEYDNQLELIENRSGEVGQPGYSIDLTNSFHSFAGSATAAVSGKNTTFDIQTYYGDADLNITKITIVDPIDNSKEFQIYSNEENLDKNSIYYPNNESPYLRIDYERKNVIVEEDGETFLSNEGTFTLTTGPFPDIENSSFLQQGGKITLKISVSADNLITRTFTRDFGYNINYDNNSYYLVFPNGNSITYLPSKNSYSPDTLTVVANQKNSNDLTSEYAGKIWYALDDGRNDLTWVRIEDSLYLKTISPSIKRIQFELYSENSSPDTYPDGKDLLDLEDIPILHSLEGTEIGGENLLLWTKEFPIESDKWNTVEAIVVKKEADNSEESEHIIIAPNIKEQEEEECFILEYDKNILNKDEEIGEVEDNKNVKNIEENTSSYFIYLEFNKAEMMSPFSRYLQEYNDKNFIFSYHYLESYKADYDFILTVYDSEKKEIGSYSLKESLNDSSEDQFVEGAVWEKEKILFNFSQINFEEGKRQEEISYFTISFRGILTEGKKLFKRELISFKKMKLELGNIATDWRESPYDIEYKDLIPANLISYEDSYCVEIKDGDFKEFKIPAEYLQDYCVSWANVENLTNNTRKEWKLEILGIFVDEDKEEQISLIDTDQDQDFLIFNMNISSSYSFNNNKVVNFTKKEEGEEEEGEENSTNVSSTPCSEIIFKFSLPAPALEINKDYLIRIHQLKIEKNSKPTGYFLGDDFIEQLAKKFGDDSILVEELNSQFSDLKTKNFIEVIDADARIQAISKKIIAEELTKDESEIASGVETSSYFTNIKQGIVIDASEQDGPYIEISTENIPYNLEEGKTRPLTKQSIKITDSKISFTEDNNEVAYITGYKLYITQAHLRETFIIGEEKTSGELVVSITPTGVGFKWGQIS